MTTIIDRRKNTHDKSLPNRKRFMDRAKKSIQDAARKQIGNRSIKDTGDAEVTVPTDGIGEPRFRHTDEIGDWDYVLPGNKEYVPGDMIDKPQQGGGSGRQGAEDGDGEDPFNFAMSYQEYLDVIFDDLELPDLIKESEKSIVNYKMRRAGHTNDGSPSNLNVERTAIAGISRRIALKTPKLAQIKELEAERATLADECKACANGGYSGLPGGGCSDCMNAGEIPHSAEAYDRIVEIDAEISALRRRALAVGFLDDVDLRYNNFVKTPKPVTQAVMFMILDVSASMGEREKIIAKKYFILLSLFLRRRYKDVEFVFIRHHSEAEEVDEETFFTGRATGGTVVSTAYAEMKKIIAARYPLDDWNVYLAQASDGDNFTTDNAHVERHLGDLLQVIQWAGYIEIMDESHAGRAMFWANGDSNLWTAINGVRGTNKNLAMAKIMSERDIIQVFRELFGKDRKEKAA